MNQAQHKGELIVAGRREQHGQVTGTTYVRNGGMLIAHGQLAGGLIVEPGGTAIVHGQVSRNIINDGQLTIYGQVVGSILGNAPTNELKPNQVIGEDLPVPFTGTSESWSVTYNE